MNTFPGISSAEADVTGTCDSCDRIAELFELPGREDRNCSQCDSDLSTMIVLFEALNDAERLGIEAGELEGEVTEILRGFLERCGLEPSADREPSR